MFVVGDKISVNSYIFFNRLTFNNTNYTLTGGRESEKERGTGRESKAQLESMNSGAEI